MKIKLIHMLLTLCLALATQHAFAQNNNVNWGILTSYDERAKTWVISSAININDFELNDYNKWTMGNVKPDFIQAWHNQIREQGLYSPDMQTTFVNRSPAMSFYSRSDASSYADALYDNLASKGYSVKQIIYSK
ncbi:hypothetical protein KBK19_03425 [Microvirga sp. STR05]|uniref:Uncharacterized protein n=1 Tax=Hymenobacter duratus TaxID=2771356 RepID=A0ABR8JBJ0_9BACT|nr:hypothetical protein [Hymenobacter duratus]MBD2714081.1 hypothetical protein [Hymenobacter duratus]MBR7948983.1 hypothetical protein [Microvirga sp. STR05]